MKKLEKILLEKNGVIFTPKQDHGTVQSKHVIYAIQAQLAVYGYAMTNNLMHQLMCANDKELIRIEKLLLSTIKEMVGAHVKHIPLYRNFPNDVPTDTVTLWWKRFSALIAQDWLNELNPDECHLLSCGHIVSEKWFDGANYAACPICERRVDFDSPFFKESKARLPLTETSPLKLIDHKTDFKSEIKRLFNSLISRKIVLPPSDLDLLYAIIDEFTDSRNWIEDMEIPVKENVAIICGKFHAYNSKHIKTATDMLRMIVQVNMGDISLKTKTKFKKISRPNRVQILSRLETMNVENLTEDMLRNQQPWKRLGERLHPFEFKRYYPKVTTAFVVIRETKINESLKTVLSLTPSFELKQISKKKRAKEEKVIFRNWNAKFNMAVDNVDSEKIIELLLERPGEFSRKLDFILRTLPPTKMGDIFNAFTKSVGRMSTPILSTLISYLEYRSVGNGVDRIFMPKGSVTKAQSIPDVRKPLTNIDPYVVCIENELLSRFKKDGDEELIGIIDKELQQIVVPFNERNAAKTLIPIPRGSRIKIPVEETIRSFIHWVEPNGNRTDLDSTFIFYNKEWKGVGECSYCHRTFRSSAFHSGDLTSAPAPLGATEYVDLHIKKLRKDGVRYVVASIFSYNGIPFHELPTAFAGIMVRHDGEKGEIFEPTTVKQKFSISGDSKTVVPFIMDLETMELFWTDLHFTERIGYQASWSHKNTLEKQCKALVDYYSAGVRPNMFQMGCLQLAAKCETVLVRTEDGNIVGFNRNDNPLYDFYNAILMTIPSPKWRTKSNNELLPACDMGYLYTDDHVMLKDGAEVYCLYRNHTNGSLKYTQAGDVLTI